MRICRMDVSFRFGQRQRQRQQLTEITIVRNFLMRTYKLFNNVEKKMNRNNRQDEINFERI